MDLIIYINENYNKNNDSSIESIDNSKSLESIISNASSSICDSIKSENASCFTSLFGKKKKLDIANVQINSINDLRANIYCPQKGMMLRQAIACNISIICDFRMINHKIGCKKFNGRGKIEFSYDFINYKSTKTEKNTNWNTIIEFSG